MSRIAVIAVVYGLAAPAAADPYRLRSDVFVDAEPPVGLLVLHAQDTEVPWLDAEALVWTGVNESEEDGTGDALVIAVRLRDPKRRGDLRLGRFVLATGAVRPVHIDGAVATGRAWGTTLEAFGGLPVVPELGDRDYDWLTGARVSRDFDRAGKGGLSFIHRREAGRLDDQEVGLDYAIRPSKSIDVAARAAFDVTYPGIADAHVTAALRNKKWRYELFAISRSPSRMLPATSLFAAIGDVPSTELGTSALWRAAPRLDVRGSAAARYVYDALLEDVSLRANLRLDERGIGAVAVELRRTGRDASGWTGARMSGRVPIAAGVGAAAELELVVPDKAGGRGDVWPWGLVALSWRHGSWESAIALEASASSEYESQVSGLFRIARRWGK